MTETLSKAKAEQALKSNYGKAEKLIANKDDFENFLRTVEKRVASIPKIGKDLAVVPAMISLLKNFIEGKYRHVPYGTILAITSSLIYFVSPIDIVPDAFPGVGLIDDAAVIAFCLNMVKSDLEEYNTWRKKKGLL